MNFAERHAHIEPDPFNELNRRTALWASCPDANGEALKPAAQIVPRATIDAALVEIWALRNRVLWLYVANGLLLVAIVVILMSK